MLRRRFQQPTNHPVTRAAFCDRFRRKSRGHHNLHRTTPCVHQGYSAASCGLRALKTHDFSAKVNQRTPAFTPLSDLLFQPKLSSTTPPGWSSWRSWNSDRTGDPGICLAASLGGRDVRARRIGKRRRVSMIMARLSRRGAPSWTPIARPSVVRRTSSQAKAALSEPVVANRACHCEGV